MNLEFFIAKRIAFSKQSKFSHFIVKIAIAAIALSLAIMIVAVSIVSGFEKAVSEKIFGFWGHIRITAFDNNTSYEDLTPLDFSKEHFRSLDTLQGVAHYHQYINKAGILKSDKNALDGIIIQGIGSDFNWTFFQKYILKGSSFEVLDSVKSNKIFLSEYTAERLGLEVNDTMLVNFFDSKRIKMRQTVVAGIFRTGLKEFDEAYALMDIGHLRKLNKWSSTDVGGIAVYLDDPNKMDQINENIYYNILDHETSSNTIKRIYPSIFEWLELPKLNQKIILFLMMLIAIINMVSALLILILERTRMIGILKALGAANWSIRKVFLINASFIIFIGLVLGNLIGIGLCLLQSHFEFISIPEESYYLSTAPVDLNLIKVGWLNFASFFVCLFALMVPSVLVSFITPIKAIRFE